MHHTATLLRTGRLLTSVALVAASAAARAGQTLPIPANASALEGTPTVKVEATQEGAKRRTLTRAEAAAETLAISVVDGRYYWASQGNRPLTLTSSGDMIYLSSVEPGRYVRIRTLNDRLTYVEHLDMGSHSVTYWGELRIALKK